MSDNDVSIDPPTVPGHSSTIRCACRMEKPVHRLTEICIHETGDHQRYLQICTELHYTSGGRREKRGTGGRGG